MKLAIVDDNEIEQEIILNTLDVYSKEHSVHFEIETFSDGGSFLGAYQSVDYDLVFMDIFMSGMNGMETAKKLISRNSRVQIVFGSTSTEFAAEAFDIEALHYMVKPVRKEKLFHILDRFFDSVYSLRTVNVKVGRLEESIYISDILYAEADGKRAKIHTKKGVIDASMSMADLEKVLPANEFCRPIRWVLVSMREIVAMPTDILKLSDKTEIPISRLKRKEIQDAFANYSWRSTRRRMRGGIL